jgi:ubiquinone/menaquinone biosynthesis C-methylase UbiE
VGPAGLTLALDISTNALAECRHVASTDQLDIQACLGDAVTLPFADATFDAVLTRSVLIYLEQKEQAVHELHRVLRPRGVVSIFEPINRGPQDYLRNSVHQAVTFDFLEHGSDGDLHSAHQRVIRHLQRRAPKHQANFVDFDERDLVRWFADAGFTPVRLSLEVAYTNKTPKLPEVIAWLKNRPNPGALSYEEAANEVLAGAAGDHLQRLATHIASSPRRHLGASAYLTARKR